MFRKAIRVEAYRQAEIVSDPLNLFDAAPNADGAAAVVLTRADLLPSAYARPLVKIAASAVSTDTLALHDRHDLLGFWAARESVELARHRAGVTLEEIDFFEYHDAYSIYAALSLEAAGFAPRGEWLETGRPGRDCARWAHSLRHDGRAEGAWFPGRGYGRVSGRRGRAATARRGQCLPGGGRPAGVDSIAWRPGFDWRSRTFSKESDSDSS